MWSWGPQRECPNPLENRWKTWTHTKKTMIVWNHKTTKNKYKQVAGYFLTPGSRPENPSRWKDTAKCRNEKAGQRPLPKQKATSKPPKKQTTTKLFLGGAKFYFRNISITTNFVLLLLSFVLAEKASHRLELEEWHHMVKIKLPWKRLFMTRGSFVTSDSIFAQHFHPQQSVDIYEHLMYRCWIIHVQNERDL